MEVEIVGTGEGCNLGRVGLGSENRTRRAAREGVEKTEHDYRDEDDEQAHPVPCGARQSPCHSGIPIGARQAAGAGGRAAQARGLSPDLLREVPILRLEDLDRARRESLQFRTRLRTGARPAPAPRAVLPSS